MPWRPQSAGQCQLSRVQAGGRTAVWRELLERMNNPSVWPGWIAGETEVVSIQWVKVRPPVGTCESRASCKICGRGRHSHVLILSSALSGVGGESHRAVDLTFSPLESWCPSISVSTGACISQIAKINWLNSHRVQKTDFFVVRYY